MQRADATLFLSLRHAIIRHQVANQNSEIEQLNSPTPRPLTCRWRIARAEADDDVIPNLS